MKKYCSRCGKFHDFNDRCIKRDYFRKEADKFHHTNVWTQKAAEIKERDHWLCQMCLQEGKLTHEGISVHHIEKLRDRYDLRLDDNNLITLCDTHHKEADAGLIKVEMLRELIKNTPPHIV